MLIGPYRRQNNLTIKIQRFVILTVQRRPNIQTRLSDFVQKFNFREQKEKKERYNMNSASANNDQTIYLSLTLFSYSFYCLAIAVLNYFASLILVCQSPITPDHGNVNADGSTASYTCDLGYTISGVTSRTCSSAGTGWSETDPTCSIIL